MSKKTHIRQVIKSLRHISSKSFICMAFISILAASLFTQVASALDEEYYSGNDIFFYSPEACGVDRSSSSASLVGNDNAEKIWNFLIGKGLSPEQAAGIMGNLQAESGFNPGIEEKGNSIGFGIAQWSFGRRDALEAAAKKKGVPVSDLGFQLEYLYEESNSRQAKASYGGGNEWEGLKKQQTVDDALVYWHDNYERSADSRARVLGTRGGFAHDAYNSFKNLGSTGDGQSSGDASNTGAVVFLDPGHGGAVPRYTDPQSHLVSTENHNTPESEDVFDVASRVKAELEKLGYTVILSHNSPTDAVKFRDRSNAAEFVKANIAVSIHTTPGEINEVWPQRVGTYRQYQSFKTTFDNQDTAGKSEQYAGAFAQARTAAEGHTVTTDPGNKQQASSFNRDGIESKGNISLVQLWAPNVPWVYNEIAQDQGTAISEARKAAYTKGIVEGVKASIPAVSPNNRCENGAAFGGGDLAQTTTAYAWPTYKGLTIDAKPEWTTASKKARSEGRYIGGIKYPGIDCGGFVTTLLVDSGFATDYNYGGKSSEGAGPTGTQRAWAEAHWKNLGNNVNAADLQPGDVAHLSGHTFIFVGDIPGFDSQIASASLDERAPMAGKEKISASGTTWFRKK